MNRKHLIDVIRENKNLKKISASDKIVQSSGNNGVERFHDSSLGKMTTLSHKGSIHNNPHCLIGSSTCGKDGVEGDIRFSYAIVAEWSGKAFVDCYNEVSIGEPGFTWEQGCLRLDTLEKSEEKRIRAATGWGNIVGVTHAKDMTSFQYDTSLNERIDGKYLEHYFNNGQHVGSFRLVENGLAGKFYDSEPADFSLKKIEPFRQALESVKMVTGRTLIEEDANGKIEGGGD